MRSGQAERYLPFLTWGRGYDRAQFSQDAVAAVIVTVMLIPQSLAYALLAGLPAEVGLYASILPLVVYAVFGSSRVLAVGPVAIVSLMTATAVGEIAAPGTVGYLAAAVALALVSGAFLVVMGLLRLGFLANFLSHPVITGFITASGLIIAASQLRHVFGIELSGHTVPGIYRSLLAGTGPVQPLTAGIGIATIAFLVWARSRLAPRLQSLGLRETTAALVARAAPLAAVLITIALSAAFDFQGRGVAVVGAIPGGLPALALPGFAPELWQKLAGSAFLISVIGYVESVSVAQTLAARRRQRIDLNQELVGLGAANIASACSGAYPVTGGFARSVVNYDAGASTPAAGAMTALGIGLVALFFTPWLYGLPVAVLAATIIVAVLSLLDMATIRETWRFSRSDFACLMVTIFATLFVGVESGVLAGVALSIGLHLYHSSRPHCAVVGLVAGTEHFRNCQRHKVQLSKTVLTVRVDESLYFANARFLEDHVYALAAANLSITDMVLMCPAVNDIDASALDSLKAINERLASSGVRLHLSEVKGPVMDKLQHSDLLDSLTGRVFLTQYEALTTLDPTCAVARQATPAGAAPREGH